MPRGVLEHDDRIVDNETGGHRERHQAQVVEGIAEQIHHTEGAEQRHDGGDGRDQRRPRAAQERADDDDYQRDRDQQRDLDFAQRRADRGRSVGGDVQLNVRWQLRGQLRQQCAHAVHRRDDVGAGLARDENDDRRFAVEQAQRLRVLDAIDDLGHVRKAYRRPIAPRHHHRRVVGGSPCRRLRVDLQPSAIAFDRTLGPICVAGLNRRANVLGADAEAVQSERQQLDTHRRQRAAADFHIAHSFHLCEPLADDVRHRLVDLPGRPGL